MQNGERERKGRHLTLQAVRTRSLADLSPPAGSFSLTLFDNAASGGGVRWRGNSRGNSKVADFRPPDRATGRRGGGGTRRKKAAELFSRDDAYCDEARDPKRVNLRTTN